MNLAMERGAIAIVVVASAAVVHEDSDVAMSCVVVIVASLSGSRVEATSLLARVGALQVCHGDRWVGAVVVVAVAFAVADWGHRAYSSGQQANW